MLKNCRSFIISSAKIPSVSQCHVNGFSLRRSQVHRILHWTFERLILVSVTLSLVRYSVIDTAQRNRWKPFLRAETLLTWINYIQCHGSTGRLCQLTVKCNFYQKIRNSSLFTLQLMGQQQHYCESQVPGIWDEDEWPRVCQQLT